MELFVKKFVDCFDEDLQQIIFYAKKTLDTDKICIIDCECRIKKLENEKLSNLEYIPKYFGASLENDIKNNKSIIENCKERIAKNENKLSFYNSMNKILSVLK